MYSTAGRRTRFSAVPLIEYASARTRTQFSWLDLTQRSRATKVAICSLKLLAGGNGILSMFSPYSHDHKQQSHPRMVFQNLVISMVKPFV